MYENLALDVAYAEPLDAFLDTNIFEIKSLYEKNTRTKNDEQPNGAAHLALPDFLGILKTKTHTEMVNFFSVGLSMDLLVQITL